MPVNNRCFRILIENFLAAMQVGRVWGPGHDRFCKFLSSEKFVFRMYNLYKMLFIVNFLTRLKLSIHTNFNVQEAKIVDQEIFHPRLCTVSEQFFFVLFSYANASNLYRKELLNKVTPPKSFLMLIYDSVSRNTSLNLPYQDIMS